MRVVTGALSMLWWMLKLCPVVRKCTERGARDSNALSNTRRCFHAAHLCWLGTWNRFSQHGAETLFCSSWHNSILFWPTVWQTTAFWANEHLCDVWCFSTKLIKQNWDSFQLFSPSHVYNILLSVHCMSSTLCTYCFYVYQVLKWPSICSVCFHYYQVVAVKIRGSVKLCTFW